MKAHSICGICGVVGQSDDALMRGMTPGWFSEVLMTKGFIPVPGCGGTTVLYVLSTLAQTCTALAAFVGAVGLYRLQ